MPHPSAPGGEAFAASATGFLLLPTLAGRDRDVDPVLQAEEPYTDAQGGAQHREHGAVAAARLRDDEHAGAEQRGDRVELVAQDGRDVAQQHVAKDAAADPGDGSEQGRRDGPDAEVECLRRAGDAEQTQTDRVEDQDAAFQALQHGSAEEADQPGGGRRGQIAPVAKGRRRHADQQVAGDAAGQPGAAGEHDRAEEVELGAHRGQAAAETEDERPREIEGEDQRRVEAARDVHPTTIMSGTLEGRPTGKEEGMTSTTPVLAGLDAIMGGLEDLYRDVHAHPELSLQERLTAEKAAVHLEASGYEVTRRIGGTGVVGLLSNGDGPTVMLRADMDALPVEEATGLPYASTATATDPAGGEVPVMPDCGHDMHVAWLAGATALLAGAREAWRGTVLAVFQPAEETAQGARAMIDDGLFDRFPKPQVILGQHVMPAPAGTIGYRLGTTQAAADSLDVRLFGRGAHGSMPESSVDPVVMAASTVLRLQTIVSREVAASQAAVVTIGALQAGTKDNVIPDEALLKLNVRTFDEQVRAHVLDAIKRIVEAEASASGAPRAPEITMTEHYPLTVNDPERTARVAAALRRRFGEDRVQELSAPVSASEDFGSFGTEWGVPSVFWYVGGTDARAYREAEQAGRIAQDIPTNHNARFAPVIHPTLETGVQAITAAALDAFGADA